MWPGGSNDDHHLHLGLGRTAAFPHRERSDNVPINLPVALLSYLPMFGFLITSITSTLREWSWWWRLALHAGWLFAAAVPTVLWLR